MKIVLVITELEPGGAERNLTRLALGLQQLGHHVTVVSLASPPLNGALTDQLLHGKVNTLFLNCNSKWAFLKAFFSLRKVLRDNKPDIVQSFLYHANLLCSMVLRKTSTKHFIGLRVTDPRPKRYMRLARHQKNWAGVICVSEDVRKHAAKFFPNTNSLAVIPNGLDLNVMKGFSSANWPSDVETAPQKLVFVGRLDHQKGIDSILEHVPNWIANSELNVYIIGDGPLRSELEAQCRHTPWVDRIHFLGYRDDALAFVANSDLFLFPSRWEGMPNAVMEAMALGRVVCATPVDGINELLAHEERQISPRDTWGEAVTTLLSLSCEERSEIGKANYQKISQSYTSRQMVERYLEFYERN